jgi:hypothetical protein
MTGAEYVYEEIQTCSSGGPLAGSAMTGEALLARGLYASGTRRGRRAFRDLQSLASATD